MQRPALVALCVGIGLFVVAGATPAARLTVPGRPSPRTTWSEFVRSNTATKLGLDNTPPRHVLPAMMLVAERIVEPLRAVLGSRVRVTSGYRSAAVNRAVGGDSDSPHLQGEAVDIVVQGLPPSAVARLVVRLGLPVTELFVYPGPNGHLHARV